MNISDSKSLYVDANGDVVLKKRMTAEEFMEWSDENVMAEWVDGKVIIIGLTQKAKL